MPLSQARQAAFCCLYVMQDGPPEVKEERKEKEEAEEEEEEEAFAADTFHCILCHECRQSAVALNVEAR
jgi:hypothetical protein